MNVNELFTSVLIPVEFPCVSVEVSFSKRVVVVVLHFLVHRRGNKGGLIWSGNVLDVCLYLYHIVEHTANKHCKDIAYWLVVK